VKKVLKLMIYLKKQESEEQINPKVNRIIKIIKVRTELNEIENLQLRT
jgi:hypothetical protein